MAGGKDRAYVRDYLARRRSSVLGVDNGSKPRPPGPTWRSNQTELHPPSGWRLKAFAYPQQKHPLCHLTSEAGRRSIACGIEEPGGNGG